LALRPSFSSRLRFALPRASYGGYAALMGLIRDPELYRCGVAWVGVTNIELLYTRAKNLKESN
jgi:hypothetical protein